MILDDSLMIFRRYLRAHVRLPRDEDTVHSLVFG